MADLADLAQEQNETAQAANLATYRRPTGPQPIGTCHSCGAEFHGADRKAKRWCDAQCRDDWERFGSSY